jgi:hypothetical protein
MPIPIPLVRRPGADNVRLWHKAASTSHGICGRGFSHVDKDGAEGLWALREETLGDGSDGFEIGAKAATFLTHWLGDRVCTILDYPVMNLSWRLHSRPSFPPSIELTPC